MADNRKPRTTPKGGEHRFTPSTEPHKHVEVSEKDLRPDQLEDLLLEGSDPHKSLVAAAKQCGFDQEVTQRLLDRLKSQFQPVLGEMRAVKTQEFLKALDDRAYRALMYMDDLALAKASAKDLAIIVGVMLEKRQLLRGEPTQILSVEDRHSMNELLPALLNEAQKRGMFVDVIEGMVDVTPRPAEDGPPNRAKMPLHTRLLKYKQGLKDDIGEPG